MRLTDMKREEGFTLIELLVVIAIIAVVTAVILPNLGASRGKARDAQRVSDVGQLQFALQLFYDRCGQYPSPLATTASNGCPSGITLGSFISQIPTPPAGGGTGQSTYDYATQTISGSIANYVIHAILESYNAAVAKGLNAWPSGTGWSTTYTCSNGSTSTNYCVTSN